MKKYNVLISSRNPDLAQALSSSLALDSRLTPEVAALLNGNSDPLRGRDKLPNALLMVIEDHSKAELESLASRPPELKPPLIVIGGLNPDTMRLAVRAGARDFLQSDAGIEDIRDALLQLLWEEELTDAESNNLVSFINAKGGSGSSFLAANFAHISQSQNGLSTLLIDVDQQFAALAPYLDVTPEAGLNGALHAVGELDTMALEAFVSRHESGLAIMASRTDRIQTEDFSPVEEEPAAIGDLLELLVPKYARIVADVPRFLDASSAEWLLHSQKIVLVLQQSVPSLRDAVVQKNILTRDLGIDAARITPLVNRYEKSRSMSLDDIKKALGVESVLTVANDFTSVAKAVDLGEPISLVARKSPVTTTLIEVAGELNGISQHEQSGFLQRSLSALRGG